MAPSNMIGTVIGAAALLASPASAFWRLACPGRLMLERIDPIVNPGAVSGHVHTVSGGSGMGFTTSFDQLRNSACSSCPLKQDLSAYWTPKLYYQAQDGTFEDVPQSGEGNGITGGMTVYYEQRPGDKNEKIHAFPAGFRMLAGDANVRNFTNVEAAPGNAVSFACLNYNGPAPAPQGPAMPNVNCPNGLRVQVFFPSCWDGMNLDTPDHKSHMAYPEGHYDTGNCPSSHPVHLISIFFEVLYSTDQFANRWYNPNKHPFVFAMGDPTGYGFHGDFVNGWDVDVLQKAADQCNSNSGNVEDCHVFDGHYFTDAESHACQLPNQVNEQVTGKLKALPGCNPVTPGPERAPTVPCNNPPIGTANTGFTDETSSLHWSYAGCAKDSSTRTFQGASTAGNDMTVEKCINFCKSKGFKLAGMEYANQCYCDNVYHETASDPRKPQPNVLGQCFQPCAGNAQQSCGGSNALSVYQDCAGGACQNAVFTVNGTHTRRRGRRHLNRSHSNALV